MEQGKESLFEEWNTAIQAYKEAVSQQIQELEKSNS